MHLKAVASTFMTWDGNGINATKTTDATGTTDATLGLSTLQNTTESPKTLQDTTGHYTGLQTQKRGR